MQCDQSFLSVSSIALEGPTDIARAFSNSIKLQISELTSDVVELIQNKDYYFKESLLAKSSSLEKELTDGSSHPEISIKLSQIFFKKCQKMVELQRVKIAEVKCEPPKEVPPKRSATKTYDLQKSADLEESVPLVDKPKFSSSTLEKQGMSDREKLQKIEGEFRSFSKIYDSINQLLDDQSDQLTIVDRALEAGRVDTAKGTENLTLARVLQSSSLSLSWRAACLCVFFFAFLAIFVFL